MHRCCLFTLPAWLRRVTLPACPPHRQPSQDVDVPVIGGHAGETILPLLSQVTAARCCALLRPAGPCCLLPCNPRMRKRGPLLPRAVWVWAGPGRWVSLKVLCWLTDEEI